VDNLEELFKKSCTGEISQDSSSAIFIQISCFAAEIFYWYFTGTEKSAFQAKLAKIGQFFVYNFAKKK